MQISRLMSVFDRNLGRCPRCMKTAFSCAVVSWPLFLALWLVSPNNGLASWASVVPIGLTALWFAHVGTYGARVLQALRTEYLGGVPSRAAASECDFIDRRRLLWVLGTAASLTVFASVWLPTVAFALGHPCGTGRHCPDSAPNCCSRSQGKCCNTGWACTVNGKCYASHSDARAACGANGIVWACS